MTVEQLSIGEVATATGLAVTAVRYYDEIGVIRATGRVGGKRRFDPEAIGRINFVRSMQDAGFSLDQIKLVLDDTAGVWRALVDEKLGELERRRAHLDAMIETLTEIRRCGCEVVATCPRSPLADADSV